MRPEAEREASWKIASPSWAVSLSAEGAGASALPPPVDGFSKVAFIHGVDARELTVNTLALLPGMDLVDKGYDVTYREVPFGHDWNNWRPLLPEVLVTFLGRD